MNATIAECGVRNAECGVRDECAKRAGQSEEAEVLMATPFNCGSRLRRDRS